MDHSSENDLGDLTPQAISFVGDDSGYLTNTPLSCETVPFADRPEILSWQKAFSSSNIVQLSTPPGAASKYEPQTVTQIPRKIFVLNGIAQCHDENKLPKSRPLKKEQNCGGQVFDVGSKLLLSSDTNLPRKRATSYPNILIGEPTWMDESGAHNMLKRGLLKRLNSIDVITESNKFYQGWCFADLPKASSNSKIDFVYQLGVKSYHLSIVHQIFSLLELEDLASASKVSKAWNQTILGDKVLAVKLKMYTLQQKAKKILAFDSKENFRAVATGKTLGRRSSCADIKNQLVPKRGVAEALPMDPSDKSAQVARENDGWLRLCPRCSHWAYVKTSEKIASCMRESCGWHFCSCCLFSVHSGQCRGLKQKTVKKCIVVGGKESKRNLRRL